MTKNKGKKTPVQKYFTELKGIGADSVPALLNATVQILRRETMKRTMVKIDPIGEVHGGVWENFQKNPANVKPRQDGDGLCVSYSFNTFSIANLSAKLWEIQQLKDLAALVPDPTDNQRTKVVNAKVHVQVNSLTSGAAYTNSQAVWYIGIIKLKDGGTVTTTEETGSLQTCIESAVDSDYRFDIGAVIQPDFHREMAYVENFEAWQYFSSYEAQADIDISSVMAEICRQKEERKTLTTEAAMPQYLLIALCRTEDNGVAHNIHCAITYQKETISLA